MKAIQAPNYTRFIKVLSENKDFIDVKWKGDEGTLLIYASLIRFASCTYYMALKYIFCTIKFTCINALQKSI